MPRQTTLLHPQRPPARLREAATVLLLRDGADGLEVLMTRRSMTASFAAGAYVFPGGGIDALDKKQANVSDTASYRATQSIVARAQALAAIRESFEELGILLARDAQGAWASQATIDAMDRNAAFYPQLAQHGLTAAAAQVYLLAHWVTDRDLPRRFDVPFLVARMPSGQQPVADDKEQFEPLWIRPADALARHAADDFFIIFPTIRTLERLQKYATVDAVLNACMPQQLSERPLFTSCPRAGLLNGQEARYMEHEPPYGELAMVTPDGQLLHPLDWQHAKAVPLLKNVMRLTAPNPSFMTGPGTNTYIIGTADSGYTVVDPGPADAAHIQRILEATGGDICQIICTHSHADHSPAAKPLQALVRAKWGELAGEQAGLYSGTQANLRVGVQTDDCPILGIASAPTSRANAQFTPDRILQNNEQLKTISRRHLAGKPQNTGLETTLRVIHTPGHAANHLCLVLEEDGLLISGDHILNGSTTVVDPPDGDMTDYLNSLDTLTAACAQYKINFILPAHGYVLSACDAAQGPTSQAPALLGNQPEQESKHKPDNQIDQKIGQHSDSQSDSQGGAARAIAALKTHRLKREAKVIAAMRQMLGASVEQLVPLAYDDVDARLWPVAARSLTAHVQRIEALGLASTLGRHQSRYLG